MEINHIELKKLSKPELIEIIQKTQERLKTMEECENILRNDSRRFIN